MLTWFYIPRSNDICKAGCIELYTHNDFYRNLDDENEVMTMLDRKIECVLSVLTVLLVGCSNVEENKEIETVQEENTGSYILR